MSLQQSSDSSRTVKLLQTIFGGQGDASTNQLGEVSSPSSATYPDVQHFNFADLKLDESPEFVNIDDLVDEFSATEVGASAMAAGRRLVADRFYGSDATLSMLRMKAGLSQKQLGDACGGLEQPHVSRYESGKTEPSFAMAMKMASALGVTLDEFAAAWTRTKEQFEQRSSNG